MSNSVKVMGTFVTWFQNYHTVVMSKSKERSEHKIKNNEGQFYHYGPF